MQQQLTFNRRIPLAVLIVGLLFTFFAYSYSVHIVRDRDQERLTTVSEEVVTALGAAVNIVTYGLGGANGIFAASDSVQSDEWHAYVSSRDLELEFPGVFGFGFVEYVKKESLASFFEQLRKDGQANFQINTSGNFDDLFVIKYMEPQEKNQPALGFDIGSDPIRREAAEIAIVTGKPSLSRRVHLVQDKSGDLGFLYLSPVFRNGAPTETEEQRRSAIQGWVYAPFTLRKMLAPILDRYGSLISIRVFEGESTDEKNLVYRSNTADLQTSEARVVPLTVGQQPWTVAIRPKPGFYRDDTIRFFPILTGLIGLLVSFVISGACWIYLGGKYKVLISQLKEGENFVQGILDSANVAVIVCDPQGIIQVFNKKAEEWLGYKGEDLIGKSTPAIFHDPKEIAAQALEVSKRLNRKIEPGFEVFVAECTENKAVENEWSFIRKDGTRFPVMLSVTAMRDETKKLTGFMGIATDISERRRAEKQLKMATAAGKVGVWHLNLTDNSLIWDDSMFAIYDIGKPSFVPAYENWLNAVTSEDRQRFEEEMQAGLRGEKSFDTEFRINRPDGSIRHIKAAGLVEWDENGKALLMSGTNLDITEAKERESELERLNVSVEVATQAKGQFLANMSHEIRTPLTSIIGYSESLITDSLSVKEQQLALHTIFRNGNHLLGVINDILDLSKIEAGKLDIEVMPVDLAELLSDVANLMMHKANEKGLSLGFDYVFPIPRRILTDSIRLKQILINLVGNAVKFTSEGGIKINVVHIKADQKILFSIIDTGPGLTKEQSSKLFQAFSQADTSITRKFGGSGLGLVISNELAHKLGGEITLESEIGKGSVFTLSISTGPITSSDMTFNLEICPTTFKMPITTPTLHLDGHILVAEDGEDNRALISFLLKKLGVQFTIVENGALALEKATTGSFDLLLMDVQMPVMDGLTATKRIRERGLKLPIVALTANAMRADVDIAMSVGCDDFLGKPFTRTELFSKIGKYLKPAAEIDAPVIIEEYMASLLRDVPGMIKPILTIINNLPKRYEEILNAFNGNDLEKTSLLAHSLRGATGNIGLIQLSEVLGEIENAANIGDKEVLQNSFPTFEDLTQRAKRLVGQLQREFL